MDLTIQCFPTQFSIADNATTNWPLSLRLNGERGSYICAFLSYKDGLKLADLLREACGAKGPAEASE